jgi:hypothetical protein
MGSAGPLGADVHRTRYGGSFSFSSTMLHLREPLFCKPFGEKIIKKYPPNREMWYVVE